MRVLIAGCGDIGTALGLALTAMGHAVFGLRRRADVLPPAITPVAADLADAASLAAVPAGLDAVFYLATPGAQGAQAYQRAYVDGVRNLIDRLMARGERLDRFVYSSSTSVYAQDDGGWVDENSLTNPTRYAGQAVLAGEGLAADAPGRAVSVRFGGIYGPGRTRLLDQVRAGAACVADPPQYTNRIYRDDCVGVLAHVLLLPAPAPCYLAVDDAPAASCEVLDWLAQRMGAPRPRREPAGSGARRAGSKRCSNALLRGSGYALRYPTYRDGYTALLADAGPGA